MKNNLVFPIIASIIATFIGGFLLYYFTRSSPDVRYTLSDSIPVSFLNPTGNPEIIQQLKVQNSGSESAKNIQVKIKGEITSKLDKHSNADEEKIYNQDKNFELLYPELPPQAGFTLTIKSQGSEINKSNLSVSYNLGLAQEAFVKNNSSSSYITLFTFSLWIIAIIFYLQAMQSFYKQSSLKYKNSNEIIEMKKPWYIRQSKWQKIVEETLSYRIGRDYMTDKKLNTSDCYNILCSDKPNLLNENAWNNLLEKATEKFKSIYSHGIAHIYDANKFLEFLRQEKPKNISNSVWSELQSEGEEKYCESKNRRLHDTEKLIIALKSQKPDEISEESWIDLNTKLRKSLTDELEHKIYVHDSPYTYLQNLDLSVLESESLVRLKKFAYRKQFDVYHSITSLEEAKIFLSLPKLDWLNEDDYLILKRRAEKIIKIEEKELDYEEKLTEQKSLTDEVIREYHQKIDDLSTDRKRIDTQWKEVSKLKQKIETQLEVINAVINEPEKIERIEDYSHSFAPGNFENLKKLAELKKVNSANL